MFHNDTIILNETRCGNLTFTDWPAFLCVHDTAMTDKAPTDAQRWLTPACSVRRGADCCDSAVAVQNRRVQVITGEMSVEGLILITSAKTV